MADTTPPPSAERASDVSAEPPVPAPTGPFEGRVKRLKRRGVAVEGQIDAEGYDALVRFDAGEAGADDSWAGRTVRFFVQDGRAVDVTLSDG